MANRKTCITTQPCARLFLIICLMCSSYGQELVDNTNSSTKTLEDSVVADMLKIVDGKFDTLTTRITAIEAAVSSLQLYSIRHFRQISGSLQSMDKSLESVGKQVTKLDNNSQSHTIVVNKLATDVSELKKTSSDFLSEFESNVYYINENLDKQGNLMKTLLEETVVRSARETMDQISKEIEKFVKQLDKPKLEPVTCDLDYTRISEHIDQKFTDFKMQTHAHLVNLINAAKFDMRTGRRFSVEENESSESDKKDQSCDCNTELEKESNAEADESSKSLSNNSRSRSDNTGSVENETASLDAERKYQDENDEKVMNALYNLTNSVLQAVSYFRNTGRLLEQILSHSELLAIQQTDLTRKVDVWMGSFREESDHSNVIPESDHVGPQQYKTVTSGAKDAERSCVLPVDVFNSIAGIMKNGSQLLEVLTDLAQLSSVALSNTTMALNDEVTRVERIRTQMAKTVLDRTTNEEFGCLTRLTNMTASTYRIIKEIASNTDWVPEILNTVQHLESITNQSLHAVVNNHAVLRLLQQTIINMEGKINQAVSTSTKSANAPYIQGRWERPFHSNLNVSKNEVTLNDETLETIYSTSLQLNRIMPALTKMLSEPDPLITLVGGGRQDQGRLEIYHNGIWGGLCHDVLSHQEADLICRHLGFKGGLSAGAGHFGPGTGVTWTFNASCLTTPECDVVTYSESTAPCSHELDSGVICDNMLRIVSTDGSTKAKLGRLEIHHRGVWIPVCSMGWSGYSARVACQQMGFLDGRETVVSEWPEDATTTWLSNVVCSGRESRLNACRSDGWKDSCPGLLPAGVRCV